MALKGVNMTNVISTILFVVLSACGSLANASELLWCRGTATITELKYNISITFNQNTHAIEVYDISDDTGHWILFKGIEAKTIGNRVFVRAVVDGENYPNVDPNEYDISYEVDPVIGFPEKLYNFTGKIGGLTIHKNDLSCKFE